MGTIVDDEYECFTCFRRIWQSMFNISREWERVDFSKALPEVDIIDTYGLECYCSKRCLGSTPRRSYDGRERANLSPGGGVLSKAAPSAAAPSI
ncbi:DNA-directed RNA polymerase subunit N (RpoN/RPB10) [Paraburkholderia youngii]